MSSTAITIRDFIVQNFGMTDEIRELGMEDDLLELLDSLQVLRLVLELEKTFAMKFRNEDMTPQVIGSVIRLAAYVDAKRG